MTGIALADNVDADLARLGWLSAGIAMGTPVVSAGMQMVHGALGDGKADEVLARGGGDG